MKKGCRQRWLPGLLSWNSFSNKLKVFLFYGVLPSSWKAYTFSQLLGEMYLILKAATSFCSSLRLWLNSVSCLGSFTGKNHGSVSGSWLPGIKPSGDSLVGLFFWLEVSPCMSAGGVCVWLMHGGPVKDYFCCQFYAECPSSHLAMQVYLSFHSWL